MAMQRAIAAVRSLQWQRNLISNASGSNSVCDSIGYSCGHLVHWISDLALASSLNVLVIEALLQEFYLKGASLESWILQIQSHKNLPLLLVPQRIKFKRLDKTARHIMQILNKEAVEEVKAQREIPDIRPGYIIQLKVEVPENKCRVTLKGIVIARRNSGINTTFRLRRLLLVLALNLFSPCTRRT
ncbi:hypothetical protein Droror1_Dr00021349 [Drosera rotundifolia]